VDKVLQDWDMFGHHDPC